MPNLEGILIVLFSLFVPFLSFKSVLLYHFGDFLSRDSFTSINKSFWKREFFLPLTMSNVWCHMKKFRRKSDIYIELINERRKIFIKYIYMVAVLFQA